MTTSMLKETPGLFGDVGIDGNMETMNIPSVLAFNQPGLNPNIAPAPSNSSGHKLMINNPIFHTYNYMYPESTSRLMATKDNAGLSAMKPEPISIPKRSNTIYETQLMCKGRGFPLWVPQPNMRLPVSQRAKGVSIGDVGIITEYGAFDFLFNICISPDDPINPRDLPEGFTTLKLKAWDIREFRDFPNGSYLASPSVGKAVKGDDRRVTTFESLAEESALLSMPEGAYHEEVNDLSKFRDYAEKHIESWYDFVLHHRGRKDTANGDIRLVVGVDKSTSWGIASFSDPFKLQLKETEDPMMKKDCPYTWEHMGRSGEVKAGPDSCDNEDLCASGSGKIRNQTLFVRTLNILLVKDVWDEIQKPKEVLDRDGASEFGVRCVSSDISMSSPNLYRMAPRLLKRPVSPDEEDEYKPRTKSPRAIPDDNPVYLRRMLARGLPVGESPETLKGEHIPVYSEAEKKIKYEWMKGSHEFLTANPPVLRKNWRVPVPKANEVAVDPSPPAQPKDEIHHVGETSQYFDYRRSSRGSSAVAYLAPPEYRKQLPPNPLKSLPSTSQPPTRRPVVEPKYSSLAHHPSKTSTIPTSTTEYRASKLRSKIHEVSERGGSPSFSTLTPGSMQEFAQEIQETNAGAEPSTPVQPENEMDSGNGLNIGNDYQQRASLGPLNISKNPQPHMHVLRQTEYEYRRAIARPVGQLRRRQETFEDLRAKANEEGMKHGSSSHVPPQGVPVHIQWSSAKGEDAVMTSTLCTDIDNSELEYEDERSSNEDPGWVKVNPESQPKKRDVSPVATKAARRPRLVTHSVVDSHSPNDTEKQSALLDLSLYNNNRLLERRARPRLSLLTWRQARRVERKSKTAPAPHCPQPNPQPSEDVVFASSCSSGTSNKHLDQQQPRTSIAGRPYLSRAEPDTQFERLDSTKFIESHKPVKSLSLGLGYGSHPLPIRSEVTSERPMDAARLGPRPKIQFNTRRDPDAGAPSNWGLHEDTSFKHPSLSINSWILGAARLPSSVKMVITHDSAWYGILDDQSLRRAHQVRLAIEHHELEATDSDAIQSLYSICVTPARMALYLEPKERWAGTVPLGMVRRVEATVAALSTDERAVFEYLLGPYGFSHLSSAMFNFRRWGQISKLKSELTTGQTRAVPSPTFDTLQQLDYHPTRPVTVEVLVQVFKGEITAREAYDRNSIGELRKTLQSAGDDEDSTQKILRKLANALLNRALEFNDKDSVEEAIFYYQHLEPSTSTESIEYLELILGFCTAHYFRHQLLRMRDDLDSLFKYLDIQSSHDFGAMLRRLGERPE